MFRKCYIFILFILKTIVSQSFYVDTLNRMLLVSCLHFLFLFSIFLCYHTCIKFESSMVIQRRKINVELTYNVLLSQIKKSTNSDNVTFNVGIQPYNYKMSTEGNVAIVTGAAQGIGRAIVTCLLSQGYQVGRFVSLSNGQQFHAYKIRNNHLPSQIIKHRKNHDI